MACESHVSPSSTTLRPCSPCEGASWKTYPQQGKRCCSCAAVTVIPPSHAAVHARPGTTGMLCACRRRAVSGAQCQVIRPLADSCDRDLQGKYRFLLQAVVRSQALVLFEAMHWLRLCPLDPNPFRFASHQRFKVCTMSCRLDQGGLMHGRSPDL